MHKSLFLILVSSLSWFEKFLWVVLAGWVTSDLEQPRILEIKYSFNGFVRPTLISKAPVEPELVCCPSTSS